MASVCLRSSGRPDVQTQRNGPKPKEKMSLKKEEEAHHHRKKQSKVMVILTP